MLVAWRGNGARVPTADGNGRQMRAPPAQRLSRCFKSTVSRDFSNVTYFKSWFKLPTTVVLPTLVNLNVGLELCPLEEVSLRHSKLKRILETSEKM